MGDRDDTSDCSPPSGATPDSRADLVAKSITATQSVITGRHRINTDVRRRTLLRTGYFKPLPPAGRIARLWAMLGLTLGRRLATVLRDDHAFIILMAAFVGVTSGAAAGLLLWWIQYAVGLFPKGGEGPTALRWAIVVGVPAIGGLLAGCVESVARRFVPGEPPRGVPAVIEAIAKRGGRLRGRAGIATGLGTGLTIGSGGSAGHEGPSVAIGATVGSVLAQFFGLTLRRKIAMVGAGSAGGLAAAFNAPLAGVIFTIELVFGGAIGGNVGTMSMFIPLIVAAVAGTFTSYAIRGEHSAFDITPHLSPSPSDMVLYLLLAVAAGVIGSAMTRLIVEVRGQFLRWSAPIWLKPALGGLAVGVIAALVSNELLGAGHSTMEKAMHGELGWKMALVLMGLKIVVTALTFGSGGFGGVFMPSLYVGACLGTLVGQLALLLLGVDAQASTAYALVGAGAIFAAMMHAPLTPIVMLFELTHDYGTILPLMAACIISVVVARRVSPTSYYKLILEQRGVVMSHEAEGEVMKRGRVRELMVEGATALHQAANLEDVRKAILDAESQATFVVDHDGRVVGFLDGNQLSKRLLQAAISPDSVAGDLMGKSRLTLLYPSDTLAGAMTAYARSGQEILPVVDGERRLLGVLRRGDLISHYTDKVLGEQQEAFSVRSANAAPGEEVGLSKGLVLERMIVGRAWAGRSLADLDLRGRSGVMVLEWARDDQVLPIDPKVPLREGDALAIVGRREQILKTRSLW